MLLWRQAGHVVRHTHEPGVTQPEIVISSSAPFEVEVVVFEEDTWRVLSAGNQVRETRAPIESFQVEAEMQQPHKPGDVVVRGNRRSLSLGPKGQGL